MPRLIDGDALEAYIRNYACIPCKKYGIDKDGVRCEFCGYGFCLDGIKRHNTIEIVRCRDCKWYDLTHPYGTAIPDAYHCKTNDRFYSAEHFCAYGERREDAEKVD